MPFDSNTIHLKIGSNLYKIFTCTSGKDGSLYIHIPYSKSKKGYVFRHVVNYKKGLSWGRITKEFVISNEAKLSVHQDGLVQFSGYPHNKIISGIDLDGKIKGIGVKSAPLDNPISSGPTVGISCWGIENGFERKGTKNDTKKFNIIFEEKDFILEGDNGEPNIYSFDLYIFPPGFNPTPRENEKGLWLSLPFPMYMHPNSVLPFSILNLKNLNNLVGVLPFKRHSSFSGKFEYGYTMHGPSELVRREKGKDVFEAIGCTYPRIFGDDVPSLNYSSKA